LWHIIETGDTQTFRIRLKVTGGTLTISSRKHSDDVISANGDLLALGRELACVYNYGNFDNVPGGTQTITTSFGSLWR
jgi:hypothetical protein